MRPGIEGIRPGLCPPTPASVEAPATDRSTQGRPPPSYSLMQPHAASCLLGGGSVAPSIKAMRDWVTMLLSIRKEKITNWIVSDGGPRIPPDFIKYSINIITVTALFQLQNDRLVIVYWLYMLCFSFVLTSTINLRLESTTKVQYGIVLYSVIS